MLDCVCLLPGFMTEFRWDVPEGSGPGPSDPNCISYVYYSPVDYIKVNAHTHTHIHAHTPSISCKGFYVISFHFKSCAYIPVCVYVCVCVCRTCSVVCWGPWWCAERGL